MNVTLVGDVFEIYHKTAICANLHKKDANTHDQESEIHHREEGPLSDGIIAWGSQGEFLIRITLYT